jgi:hypothetical protein
LRCAKGERTDTRLAYRSGYYSRALITRVGTLSPRKPTRSCNDPPSRSTDHAATTINFSAHDLRQAPIELPPSVAAFGTADAFIGKCLGDHLSPPMVDCLGERLALVIDGLPVFRRDPKIEANWLRLGEPYTIFVSVCGNATVVKRGNAPFLRHNFERGFVKASP